jgi:hypothetical protein
MAKRPARDKPLIYTVAIALAVIAAGFAIVWLYLQYLQKKNAEIRYLALPSIAISRDGHSISASFGIRTSGADVDWAAKNKMALETVMKRGLMAVDPQRVRAPNGIRLLQDTLREASNAELHTDKVQEVLITDFLVSEGDL